MVDEQSAARPRLLPARERKSRRVASMGSFMVWILFRFDLNQRRMRSPTSLRSRRQHKAWGGAQRNPRFGREARRARGAGDSASYEPLIKLNLIYFQEPKELIAKRNLSVML